MRRFDNRCPEAQQRSIAGEVNDYRRSDQPQRPERLRLRPLLLPIWVVPPCGAVKLEAALEVQTLQTEPQRCKHVEMGLGNWQLQVAGEAKVLEGWQHAQCLRRLLAETTWRPDQMLELWQRGQCVQAIKFHAAEGEVKRAQRCQRRERKHAGVAESAISPEVQRLQASEGCQLTSVCCRDEAGSEGEVAQCGDARNAAYGVCVERCC